MDYDLAKELKDAGFPQTGGRIVCPHGYQGYLPNGCEKDECGVSYPTLTQLVEACGDHFESLIKQAGGWVAISSVEHYRMRQAWRSVPTPEEAVAKLWLALNKK